MARKPEVARIVRIFVSSPGDVAAERRALDDVVDAINRTQASDHGVRFELQTWEKDVVPRIGPPPQAVVNEQTRDFDVYLGFMWGRFGTPTATHGSGTEEEFRKAADSWAASGTPWIMFYFREDAPVIRSSADAEQFTKVLKFREELQSRGIIGAYTGVDGGADSFTKQVDTHLRLLLPKLKVTQAAPPSKSKESRARRRDEPPPIPDGYRDWLRRECADVEVLGLRLREGQAVRLTSVYVPLITDPKAADADTQLQTAEPIRRDDNPHLLLRRLGEESLYVPGDAGSGKSTFCRWVA